MRHSGHPARPSKTHRADWGQKRKGFQIRPRVRWGWGGKGRQGSFWWCPTGQGSRDPRNKAAQQDTHVRPGLVFPMSTLLQVGRRWWVSCSPDSSPLSKPARPSWSRCNQHRDPKIHVEEFKELVRESGEQGHPEGRESCRCHGRARETDRRTNSRGQPGVCWGRWRRVCSPGTALGLWGTAFHPVWCPKVAWWGKLTESSGRSTLSERPC